LKASPSGVGSAVRLLCSVNIEKRSPVEPAWYIADAGGGKPGHAWLVPRTELRPALHGRKRWAACDDTRVICTHIDIPQMREPSSLVVPMFLM
jgi:hypothetical protein